MSAAAHHSTVEQMGLLYAQQQSTAKQTEDYLQQQYDNQLALNAKNETIRERLEEQQKAFVVERDKKCRHVSIYHSGQRL
ncbi:hypothetical protein PF005_g16024 [Phytophthora fragariae]|uniref:Lysozyme inhibitor LprI-like N-terminal domain-containing protein n=2 Tax=Phytophthora fragariae TaxID=53985 RepID=A0A6A3FGG7_9STRA|nr:hypothetical protein PF003_g25413 [Phytophthora fragariae]KAE8940898.1 hypothetical protein PF009_g9304 [Phytophthora fragariae]KAE9016582.1 hypothetical protein PF011_g7086 [Phytophthora fragariae]KAE9074012.1 hypothetical protein PF007_g25581 [Phytophthora fragariae]KAE9198735.1 hypothetical protein PF005_g16024 [Phytophthora fragariae]